MAELYNKNQNTASYYISPYTKSLFASYSLNVGCLASFSDVIAFDKSIYQSIPSSLSSNAIPASASAL